MFDHKEEKKVEYLELIYDLIFVYLIGRNSSLVQHTEGGFINWTLFVTYVLCTLIAIQIWGYSTFYINRFGKNGIKDHIFIFVNMYLLYFMAESTRTDWQSYYYRYNTAWGLILLNIALQYFLTYKKTSSAAPWENEHLLWHFRTLVIQAAIVFASIILYSFTGLPLAPAAMVFGLVMTICSKRINSLVSVDFSHLAERAMLYVVFTFGEMIIVIAGYFSGPFSFNLVYFSLFAFLIAAGLFLSYEIFYDHLIDREMQTDGAGYMAIHIFIIFALNSITMGLEFMPEQEIHSLPKTLYLIGAMLMFYVFLFLLGRYTGKQTRPPLSFILKVSLIGVSFIVLMIILRDVMYVNIAVPAVYVYIVFAVLVNFRKKHKKA